MTKFPTDLLLDAVSGAFCFLLLGSAHANVLSPGDSGVAPDLFSSSINFNTAQSTAHATSTLSGSGLSSVLMHTAVYADPNNPFGAGDLDFLYQIRNGEFNPNDTISLATMTAFAGFSTDVGYGKFGWASCFSDPALCAGFNPDQGYDPSSVFRSATGDEIGFNMELGPYAPASDILIIKTNAKNYSTGGELTVTGPNSSLTFDAFQPSSAVTVPEPATLALLGVGLAGLRFARRRKLN